MKKTVSKIFATVLSIAVLCSSLVFAVVPVNAAANVDTKADFMSGKYGVFLHYLPSSTDTLETWNEKVNSFDVDSLAAKASEIGASWLGITLTQADGLYCIPMPELEEITNTDCGADRDLVSDLYEALSEYGIKLMLYWIPGAPSKNQAMADKLGAVEIFGDNYKFNDTVINNMSNVMTAVSNRYGDKVSAWWIDGCYDDLGYNETYATKQAAALRAGNQNAAVTFNRGTAYFADTQYAVESYTAGETKTKNSSAEFPTMNGLPGSAYVSDSKYTENGALRHFLTPLGSSWSLRDVAYGDSIMCEKVNYLLNTGAAITFDIGNYSNGSLEDAQAEQVKTIKNYIESNKITDLDFDFENENPFIWSDNIVTNENWSMSGTELVSGADALNGKYSLKVTANLENARTEVGLGTIIDKNTIKVAGNANFDPNDFSKVTGIMLRMKLKNDNTNVRHKFRIDLMQAKLGGQRTILGKDAILYDLQGYKVKEYATGNHRVEIPAGFDGFVFLPFESAQHSTSVTNPGVYDEYKNFPEKQADIKLPSTFLLHFNDATWNGIDVLIDDIHYYSGSNQAENCDYLRALGYESVIYAEQPADGLYSLPLNFEGYQAPEFAFTGIYKSVTNGSTGYPTANGSVKITVDEAISGNISLKITNPYKAPVEDNGTINQLVVTNRDNPTTIKINGLDGFDINEQHTVGENYGYLKLRIMAPVSESGAPLNLAIPIRQDGKTDIYAGLGTKNTVYNADGTLNTAVQNAWYANYRCLSVPSGFDGTVYLPLYWSRVNDGNRSTTYGADNYANYPDLSQNFGIGFTCFANDTNTWNGKSLIVDDIDFVFASDIKLPMNFEDEIVPSFSELKYYGNQSNWQTIGNAVSKAIGNNALNGNNSIELNINVPENHVEQIYITQTNALTAKGISGYNMNDLTKVSGIMMRLKVDETEGQTEQHLMTLRNTQSGVNGNTQFKNYVVLFDKSGKLVSYNSVIGGNDNFVIPAGFDGYVFMPFVGQRNITSFNGFNTATPEKFVNFANDYTMQFIFEGSTWCSSKVTMDDITYFTTDVDMTTLADANNMANFTDDAIKAIEGLGYALEVKGDITGDGELNASDLCLLKQVLFGTVTVESSIIDLNNDGKVDIIDLIALKKLMLEVK